MGEDSKLRWSIESAFQRNKLLMAMLALLFIVPYIIPNKYFIHVATVCWILSLASLGWNVAYGYGGLFAFGHTAFFGLGAYVTIILLKYIDVIPWIGIPVGSAVGSLFGLVVAFVTARTYAFYFAIVTGTIPSVLFIFWTYFPDITGGTSGMPVPYHPESLLYMDSSYFAFYYYITLFFLLLGCVLVFKMSRSKLGYYIKAMGDDLNAAESIGIDTFKVKILCMGISTFITSMAGGIYGIFLHFMDPFEAFSPVLNIAFIMYTMFGGVGTILGPIVGASVTIGLSEIVKLYLERWMVTGVHLVIYGLILMVTITLVPSGIYPYLKKLLKRYFRRAG